METQAPRTRKYLFVCENHRGDAACCMPQGERLRELLKKSVKEAGLTSLIRVSRAGCLDMCSEGPNVLLMPDNKWFSHVGEGDLDRILSEAGRGLS